jgi:hypothetical protein
MNALARNGFSGTGEPAGPAIVPAMAAKAATAKEKRGHTRSLDEERKKRVAERLRRLVDDDFGGNQSAAAKALGVTQPFISDVLNFKRTAATAMLEAIANHSNVLVDRLLDREMTSLDVALDYMGDEVGADARRAARAEALKGVTKTPKQWGQFLRAHRPGTTDAEDLLAEMDKPAAPVARRKGAG